MNLLVDVRMCMCACIPTRIRPSQRGHTAWRRRSHPKAEPPGAASCFLDPCALGPSASPPPSPLPGPCFDLALMSFHLQFVQRNLHLQTLIIFLGYLFPFPFYLSVVSLSKRRRNDEMTRECLSLVVRRARCLGCNDPAAEVRQRSLPPLRR